MLHCAENRWTEFLRTTGDIGYFTRGELASSLEDLVFRMKVGEVSEVVRTKQGFLIIEVTEHHGPDDLH